MPSGAPLLSPKTRATAPMNSEAFCIITSLAVTRVRLPFVFSWQYPRASHCFNSRWPLDRGIRSMAENDETSISKLSRLARSMAMEARAASCGSISVQIASARSLNICRASIDFNRRSSGCPDLLSKSLIK